MMGDSGTIRKLYIGEEGSVGGGRSDEWERSHLLSESW